MKDIPELTNVRDQRLKGQDLVVKLLNVVGQNRARVTAINRRLDENLRVAPDNDCPGLQLDPLIVVDSHNLVLAVARMSHRVPNR